MTTLSGDNRTGLTALPSRLPSLTGLRFIAAFMVFLFHADFVGIFASAHASATYLSIFNTGGWVGVTFFFILSGFVLTWTARSSDKARKFWRRRFVKIYPSHVVTFIAAALLITFVARTAIDPKIGLANLFLIHSWFPQEEVRISVNDVSWSLSCEVAFYLAFPFLIKLVRRIRPEQLWGWILGVALVVVVAIPVVGALLPHQLVYPGLGLSPAQFYFILQLPPIRLFDFVFGMLLARVVQSGRTLPLSPGGAVALVVGTYALSPLFPAVFNVVAATFVPLGLVVAAFAKADITGRRTPMAGRVMVRLGEISFAFYLWHNMVLTYGQKFLGGHSWSTPAAAGVLALFAAVGLLLSWAMFTFVENPLMGRFASARKRPEAPKDVNEPPLSLTA